MRTTLDLPDDLLKKAKVRAAQQGISLKDYFTDALASHQQKESAISPGRASVRIQLPQIQRKSEGRYPVSNEQLEDALAETENLPPSGS